MNVSSKRNRKSGKKVLVILSLLLIVIILLYAWGFSLKTEKYHISSDKIDKGLKIVFVSDLHNSSYGPEQSKLIKEIYSAKPDLVLLGGDLVDQYGGTDNAVTLVSELQNDFICCYASGNHEELRDDMDEFEDKLAELGVHVLNGCSEQFTIRGQSVTVYGIKEPYQYENSALLVDSFINGLDASSYNILLAHQPEQINTYLGSDRSNTSSFDLILSGHAHGGQWRLPVILEQGLYAPDQGIFPDYTNGIYEYGDSVHLISRGLARPLRMIVIPRIFNRPELSIIEIT